MKSQKNLTIETLRGIAILLVVAGHTIGSAPDGGMKIDFPSVWRYIYIFIDYIQMPLFVAIAGWAYAVKPLSNSMLTFTFEKFKRLIIPMISVATIYFLLQYFTPGTNNKEDLSTIWRIYLFPYTMYWYLQSLFLIFIVTAVLDRLSFMKNIKVWGIVLSAACLFYILQITVIAGHSSNVFSFEGAMRLFPYFLVGLGVRRFGDQLYKNKIFYSVCAAIGVVLLQLRWFYPDVCTQLYSCLLPLWLVPTIIILLNQTFTSRWFVFLGTYSYAIYLFHGFGTSGGRIILNYLGIHSHLVIFVVATLIAVLVPIVIDKVLSKNRILGMIFLGKRY